MEKYSFLQRPMASNATCYNTLPPMSSPRTAVLDAVVETIDDRSPHLESVMRLWRASSSTLGLFPEGAFRDYAARKNILVALQGATCLGYLLFRFSRDRVVIVHLCIDKSNTGKGLARLLVSRLHETTKHLRGIGLSCRRDYAASKVWPRLGFTAVNDKPGRGKAGKELTYWWLDHNHPTLFSEATRQQVEARLPVAIDHNVFLDLYGSANPDSQALEADWLKDSIQLCLTNEIQNEINRHNDTAERKAQRAFASRFIQLDSEQEKFQAAFAALRGLFPATLSESDESDLRHLARAISCGATIFATRDKNLLNKSTEIYDAYGLLLAHPSDLIVRIDELQRGSVYQPARLAGTALRIALISKAQVEAVSETFHNGAARETKAHFQTVLRRCLSDPHNFACHVITGAEGKPYAIFVLQRSKTDELKIPLFRVQGGPVGSTLAQHIILHSLLIAAEEGRKLIRVADPAAGDVIAAALIRDRFAQTTGGWIRLALDIRGPRTKFRSELTSLSATIPEEAPRLEAVKASLESTEAASLLELERSLWPAKILDAQIPTFVVPIKPIWAQNLFDHELASEDLFGGELILNREGVYYRAAKPSCGLAAPSRILWYVSLNKRSPKSGHIRACSFLDEVAIDKPKELFRRFQRLGIYKWSDIYTLAKKDINQKIMALKFSDTVVLKKPVSLKLLRQTMRASGKNLNTVSPFGISPQLFEDLHS